MRQNVALCGDGLSFTDQRFDTESERACVVTHDIFGKCQDDHSVWIRFTNLPYNIDIAQAVCTSYSGPITFTGAMNPPSSQAKDSMIVTLAARLFKN